MVLISASAIEKYFYYKNYKIHGYTVDQARGTIDDVKYTNILYFVLQPFVFVVCTVFFTVKKKRYSTMPSFLKLRQLSTESGFVY